MLRIDRDGHLDHSEAYDMSQLVREYKPCTWGKTCRFHEVMASTQGDMAILHTLYRQEDRRDSPSSHILLIQIQLLSVQPHMPPAWRP